MFCTTSTVWLSDPQPNASDLLSATHDDRNVNLCPQTLPTKHTLPLFMDSVGDTNEKTSKSKMTSPSLGVSKSIKKSRSGDSKAKHLEDVIKDDIKKTTPVKDKKANEKKPDYSAEYNVKHPSDDTMRNKVRNLLVKALRTDDPKAEGALEVAAAIEVAIHKNFSSGAPYKNKARSLSFNLKDKKNKNLRDSVLQRELPPSKLVHMTNQELANDDLKKDREKVLEKFTKDAQPFNNPAASTDQFKCGKCKQRKVSACSLITCYNRELI